MRVSTAAASRFAQRSARVLPWSEDVAEIYPVVDRDVNFVKLFELVHINFDRGADRMSSGAFVSSKYESNAEDIYPIRIQPETLALTLGSATNTAPTAAVDQVVRAKVSGSRRAYGVHTRTVTVELTAALDDYEEGSLITLPWLQADTWEALAPDTTGTYLGVACRLAGKSPEKIK